MNSYVKYDVIMANFRFNESEEYKPRACVIIDENILLVLAIKITSQNTEKLYNYEIPVCDLKSAGLWKESKIQVSEIDIIKKENVLGVLGHLADEDIKALENEIDDIKKDPAMQFKINTNYKIDNDDFER